MCDNRVFSFETIKALNTILRKIFPQKTLKKLDRNKFDVLTTKISWSTPTIVLLEREGGYATHTIGIMGKVIFDSSNHYSLARTKENLDHACRPMKFRSVQVVAQLVDDLSFQVKTRKRKR